MAAIGGFRSDLSITRKTDGKFGNVSAGVLFSKVAINENGCKRKFRSITSTQCKTWLPSKVV